jgi:isocitrate dehydrogenase
MEAYNNNPIPSDGEAIQVRDGKLCIPDNPILPFIEGDGTGPDIWKAARIVFDAAVARAYGGRRRVAWYRCLPARKPTTGSTIGSRPEP